MATTIRIDVPKGVDPHKVAQDFEFSGSQVMDASVDGVRSVKVTLDSDLKQAVTILSEIAGVLPWYGGQGPVLDETVRNTIDIIRERNSLTHRRISEATATDFNSAQSFTRRYDPLALDLDGDGIETTGTGNWQNTTLFDHNGDGLAEGTGWLSGDDGWLVRDINGNGAIDNGSELFGDNTVRSDGSTGSDGFSALSDLDSNNDGVIDANDAAFGELKVWRDLNQDGVSQAGELATLSDHGVESIDLASSDVNQNQNGNTIRATSSFTREDGSSSTVGNLDLARASFFSEFSDANERDASLPDMHGSGAVRNLRDAASRSSSLATVSQQRAA